MDCYRLRLLLWFELNYQVFSKPRLYILINMSFSVSFELKLSHNTYSWINADEAGVWIQRCSRESIAPCPSGISSSCLHLKVLDILSLLSMLQIYERFDADSMTQADDARLEYFTKKVVLIICLVTSFSWIKYLIFFFVVFLLNESLLILFFFLFRYSRRSKILFRYSLHSEAVCHTKKNRMNNNTVARNKNLVAIT